MQDPPEIIGMVIHAELVAHDFDHAASGSKLGQKTRRIGLRGTRDLATS